MRDVPDVDLTSVADRWVAFLAARASEVADAGDVQDLLYLARRACSAEAFACELLGDLCLGGHWRALANARDAAGAAADILDQAPSAPPPAPLEPGQVADMAAAAAGAAGPVGLVAAAMTMVPGSPGRAAVEQAARRIADAASELAAILAVRLGLAAGSLQLGGHGQSLPTIERRAPATDPPPWVEAAWAKLAAVGERTTADDPADRHALLEAGRLVGTLVGGLRADPAAGW